MTDGLLAREDELAAVERAIGAATDGSGAVLVLEGPAGIGKTWSFQASVVKFKTGAQVGDAISFDAELAVSGKPTLAASVDV